MPSRRTTIRAALALGFGGLAASGTAATTPAAPGPRLHETTPVPRGDTTVFGRVDPAVLPATGLPDPLSAPFAELRSSYRSVSPDDIDRAFGTAGLGADRVEGRAVAVGSFDAESVAAELGNGGFDRRPTDGTAADVFVAPGSGAPAAVSVDDSTLRVGYGPTAERAASRLEAGVGADDSDRTRPAYGPLPSLVDGDAVAYADLGTTGRRRLQTSLASAPDGLAAVVEAAGAVGAALRVGDDIARIRYGAVVDPDRVSLETAADALAGLDDLDASMSDVSLSRRGRTLLADVTVDAATLWASHARVLDGGA